MSHMKGQDKTPEKQLSEVEKGNLPDKAFRKMIVKMIQDLIKKNGEDARNVCQRTRRPKEQTEMNNTLEGINSRTTEVEELISGLEDRMVEITTTENNTEKKKKRRRRQPKRLLDYHSMCQHSHYRDCRRRRERETEREPKKVSEEVITGHFPNMRKGIVNQIQEAQSPRHDKPKEEHTKTHCNQTGKN